MRIGQITLTSSATPLIAAGSPNVYASALQVQNNSIHNARVGDNTVTASRGVAIGSVGGGFYTAPCPPKGTLLNQWFVFGTAGDVIDFLYESAQ